MVRRSCITKLFEAKKHRSQVGFTSQSFSPHLQVVFPKVVGLWNMLWSSSFSLSTLFPTFLFGLYQKLDSSYNCFFSWSGYPFPLKLFDSTSSSSLSSYMFIKRHRRRWHLGTADLLKSEGSNSILIYHFFSF